MRLSFFDDKLVRITTAYDGRVFEGECSWFSAGFGDCELGREEEGLMIDHWVFYRSDIDTVEEISPKDSYLWMSKTVHRMHLAPMPFDRMERGEKTIEMRLYDEKRRKIRIGDVIRFESTEDETDVMYMLVQDLYVFDSFAALYRSLPLTACGYTEQELPSASPADMDRYYPPEEQRKYGVVGILLTECS